MKVYILTEGEYSDYGIVKCFATKEGAENYRRNYARERYNSPLGKPWFGSPDNKIYHTDFEDYYRNNNHYNIEEYELLE